MSKRSKKLFYKEVYLTPMTRGEYNKLRGWEVPEDENPDDLGYLVENENFKAKVHPDYDHHISWIEDGVISPFVDDDYLERMKIELAELEHKYNSLSKFINTDSFNKLSVIKQSLLKEQSELMKNYINVLDKRINLELEGN